MAGTTESAFFKQVLADMGAPQSASNVAVLEKWSVGEKPKNFWSQWWNPLNTTQPAAGAVSVNSVGVKEYATAAAGEKATAQTIQNGYYPSLAAALKSSAPLSVFQSASVVSEVQNRWGTKSFGRLIGAPNVQSQGAQNAGTVQAATLASSQPTTAAGGIDLNPVDWIGSVFGAAGDAAGMVAGGATAGVVTGFSSALGGVFRGMMTTASGSLVALFVALVITLILVGPKGAGNLGSVVVNLGGQSPPSGSPDPSQYDLSEEGANQYQADYKEWQNEQKQANKAQPGDYPFAGHSGRAAGASRAASLAAID